ncbi:efflux RND transporter permease subunit [Treponema pectinovorum]|uniref:efflux RND transporter permease subunit n=1 Tax=Treponema pectinovorum TaxID=164 RepID=UPI0011F3FAF9|nr:efflux RND transporter permease subunit [Treponema pectinovorum]
MTFSEKCVNKPVTTQLLFILAIVLGIFCTTQLPVDMYPDMDLPYMLVYTSYDNAGPEEVEQSVTATLESSLSGVSGLKKIQSRSMAGISFIFLEFNYGTNLDAAGGDVRDKIDMVRNYLPKSANSPVTIKIDPSMIPIMTLALRGERTPEELRALAKDTIKPKLEQIDGIASATISGGRESSINVDIPRDRLEAYGLTISSIAQMIGVQNIQSSGGTITSGDINYTIKNDGKYKTIADLENTVISYKAGSDYALKTIRLRDIADVYEGYKDESTLAYLDGNPCVMITLTKQSGKNSVSAAENVRKQILKLKEELPESIELLETSNTVDVISQTISEVVNSVVQGALLAIAVLFIFLRSVKSTLIVGLSIPLSVLITLVCMYLWGISINMISMAGLLLGIGMLVDNSIVVLENIYSYIQRDAKPRVAAVLGSQEMITSIMGSTLTTVCIFLPMLVFKKKLGMMGQMFNDLAYSIIFSLLSSLLVAIALVPVMCSKYVKKVGAKRNESSKFTYGANKILGDFFERLDEKYAKGVTFVLHHKKMCIFSIMGLFVISMVAIKFIGFIFMPAAASNTVTVEFEFPKGTKLSVTEDTLREFENSALKELNGIKYTTVSVGGTSVMSSTSETNKGSVIFSLYEPKDRKSGYESEKTAKSKLRKYFTMYPGVSVQFGTNANRPSNSSGVSVDVKSDDLNKVMSTARQIANLLKEKGSDWVSEVNSELEDGLPQANIIFDRERMQEFGLNIASVGSEISGVISGTTASRFTKNGDDIDVIVRVSEKDRGRLSDLDSISMVTSNGNRIPLSSFAHYEEAKAPVTIYRENQARVIHVTANPVEGLSIADVQRKVEKLIGENVAKEEGVMISYSGDLEDMIDAVKNFGLIIILAAFLVFIVMASQFESILDPFIVILTIPLSFIGVITIYAITRNQLNVVTIMGMLVLVGTIVNNGIVLVDYTNLLRKRGLELEEACVQAARNRLRPILMSTLTTVISLMPMAFFPGEGSSSMQPISLTVFGGMTFGSIMTLFLMPSIYFIFNNRRLKKAAKKAEKQKALEAKIEQNS